MEIVLPDLCLVLLLGIAGAGKSTFAHAHFAPTEIVSSDHCRALVCDDENNQSVNKAAFAILHLITDCRLAHRKRTVIDATNVQSEARASLLAIARRHQMPVVAIVFNFDLGICLQRNSQRRQRNVPSEVAEQQYADLQRALDALPSEGFHAVYVLTSPAETATVKSR
jgi:protein phosphatase